MFPPHCEGPGASLDLLPGQCWALLGRNGSGKRALAEQLVAHCQVQYPARTTVLLSFAEQQALYEEELRKDDSDFMDKPDAGTSVRELLGLKDGLPEAFAFLGLDALLDRGYRLLSSGESRKLLLARALLQQPDFLILEEPYDSLDQASRLKLTAFFREILAAGKIQLLFLFSTLADINENQSHVAVLEKGELLLHGERAEVLDNSALQSLLAFDAGKLPAWPPLLGDESVPDIIIKLRKGRVSYGETVIFSDLDLQIRRGEHTLITGPNGSGKSTLLSLFSGDHPQSYGNDLQVLSYQRGSGESIWELKRRIGIVSPELHRNHRVPGSALDIVLSGFFDSIGLYEEVSSLQLEHARHWLLLTGMAEQGNTAFRQLSYGEQRLVLIARALVKQPALLLCDEPTQGIDDINRHRFLYFLEHLATQTQTTVIMASHRADEQLDIFRHHLAL